MKTAKKPRKPFLAWFWICWLAQWGFFAYSVSWWPDDWYHAPIWLAWGAVLFMSLGIACQSILCPTCHKSVPGVAAPADEPPFVPWRP
jgi:hypothetical protein